MAALSCKHFKIALKLSNLSITGWKEAACVKFYSQYSPRFKEPIIERDKLEEAVKQIPKDELENMKVKAARNFETWSVFYDPDIVKFTNFIMRKGKRQVAQELVRLSFAQIKHKQIRKYNEEQDENLKKEIILDPREIFHLAVKNCMPVLTTMKIRRSGVWYKVPVGIKPNIAKVTAMKWIIEVTKEKKNKSDPYEIDLANELIEASQGKGRAYQKKIELHKLCETNRGYAHFWWA